MSVISSQQEIIQNPCLPGFQDNLEMHIALNSDYLTWKYLLHWLILKAINAEINPLCPDNFPRNHPYVEYMVELKCKYGGTQMQILAQQWMSPVALTFETVDWELRETEIYTNAQCDPI